MAWRSPVIQQAYFTQARPIRAAVWANGHPVVQVRLWAKAYGPDRLGVEQELRSGEPFVDDWLLRSHLTWDPSRYHWENHRTYFTPNHATSATGWGWTTYQVQWPLTREDRRRLEIFARRMGAQEH